MVVTPRAKGYAYGYAGGSHTENPFPAPRAGRPPSAGWIGWRNGWDEGMQARRLDNADALNGIAPSRHPLSEASE